MGTVEPRMKIPTASSDEISALNELGQSTIKPVASAPDNGDELCSKEQLGIAVHHFGFSPMELGHPHDVDKDSEQFPERIRGSGRPVMKSLT